MRVTQTPARRLIAATTLAALAACAIVFLLAPAGASAAPPQLWQSCESGTGAGQCAQPRGIAADPKDGHVFVADLIGNRIVEFNPLGEFVKTWGWDVVQSGPGNIGTGFEICVPDNGDVCKAGVEGSGAGQFSGAFGVAVDSAGNVYVVDTGLPSNQRVQKFSPAGQFLAAFGGDTVAFGPDDSTNKETQEISIAQSAGTFRLNFTNPFPGGTNAETAPLPFNASAAEIQTALNALPSIAGVGGSVSVTGSNPFVVTFEGNLAGDDVPPLAVTLDAGAQLKCSTPTVAESISYQWLRNGGEIEGATASTYTATAQDKGDAIQCRVTATNANAASTQLSEPGQLIAPAPGRPAPRHPASIPAPEASAPLTVGGGGQTLSCDPDEAGWKDSSGNFHYRWYRNGVSIKENASNQTYTVTAADLTAPAVFQCEVKAESFFAAGRSEAAKMSENLASSPAPSAPPAPEVQANVSPANITATLLDGGGPEVCKAADSCKAGSKGNAAGQFGELGFGDFIAIDPTDRVYVGDRNRIQRFDAGGAYQDECSVPGTVQSLATDSAGKLYAAYEGQPGVRKLSFLAGGECEEIERFEIPKLGEREPLPTAVTVEAAGRVYAFSSYAGGGNADPPLDRIFEFDPAGNVIDQFGKSEFGSSNGLATNLCPGSEAPGSLYVSNIGGSPSTTSTFIRAYGTQPAGCFKARALPANPIAETSATLKGTVNPGGTLTSECRFEYGTTIAYGTTVPCAESPATIGSGTSPVSVHANIAGLQGATVYHVRLRAKIGGETETSPDVSFKTLGPPTISAEQVVSATDTEAALKALVNPEGLATSCHVDYGPDTSYGQSTPGVSVGSDRGDHSLTIQLTGLKAGATYHWRYLCANTAVLNGGIGEGEDRTLNTYRPFAPQADCPNQGFRIGASAPLPDCRAYEMVSPVDKNGGDIIAGRKGIGNAAEGYAQVSPDGERLAYATKGSAAFGEDPPNSFVIDQYLATRDEGIGWSSEGIHQPFGHRVKETLTGAFREFSAFSPDLCSAWVFDLQSPALNPDAQPEAANLYRRQNCGADAGSFETLTTAPLPLEGSKARSSYVNRDSVQGVSADSRHAIFWARAPLTADAAAGTGAQLYDRFGGALHLVSVLPGGEADPIGATVGGAGGGGLDNLEGAVSEDGSYVYWSSVGTGSVGKIYLRRHPEQGIVKGECAKASKACTIAVSAGNNAFFWAAASDGSKALYSEGQDLYEFDLAEAEAGEAPRLIAHHVRNFGDDFRGGVTGVSKDLSRVYFLSTDVLAGSGQNSEGDEASAGQPNLYLYEAGSGSFAFVATVLEGDAGKPEPDAERINGISYNLVSPNPQVRATRVSPDGTRIAFESRAQLTGFDNTAAASGKPAVEVYTYTAGGALQCISCNPSGASPATRELPESYAHPGEGFKTRVQAAAWIPGWEHPLHASNLLSPDGNRLFFNSNDALLPRDTNGAQDVYEWEAPGTGGCDAEDASYFPQNGGCLYLISSGESPFESEFWEASPDGRDVFFTTGSSLLPQDPGSLDLYDARAGGGFPQPPEPAQCEGEACQGPVTAPNDPTPASSSFRGPGSSVKKAPSKRRCAKGRRQVRRAGKVRCVKRGAKKKASRAANHHGRAKR